MALLSIEPQLPGFIRGKGSARISMDWTNIDASPAFTTSVLSDGTFCREVSIGKYGCPSNPNSSMGGNQKTALPDPPQARQVACQLMREDSAMSLSIKRTSGEDREGLISPFLNHGSATKSNLIKLIGYGSIDMMMITAGDKFIFMLVKLVDNGVGKRITYGHSTRELGQELPALIGNEFLDPS
jgi:hypothetical protein